MKSYLQLYTVHKNKSNLILQRTEVLQKRVYLWKLPLAMRRSVWVSCHAEKDHSRDVHFVWTFFYIFYDLTFYSTVFYGKYHFKFQFWIILYVKQTLFVI